MQRGVVGDRGHMDQRGLSYWAPGSPVHSRFFGIITAPVAGEIPIGTFRCATCGFLESWARPEFKGKPTT